MNRRGAGLGLALAGLLAGCGGLGTAPAHRYFVLETAPSRLAPGAAAARRDPAGRADHRLVVLRHAGDRLQPRVPASAPTTS